MSRDLFLDHALQVAPRLLGATLAVVDPDSGEAGNTVAIRITEVEAYHGVGTPGPYDAGSHSRDRMTERNASMFGPPGHAYVYLSHGLHFALNLVCSPEGTASGVLIRAGEVIAGAELAQQRRATKRGRPAAALAGAADATAGIGSAGSGSAGTAEPIPHRLLARGPGNLAAALGITRPAHNGRDILDLPFRFEPAEHPGGEVLSGPRVGVSGEAGSAAFPWRFWIAGDPTVSAYRPGRNVPRG